MTTLVAPRRPSALLLGSAVTARRRTRTVTQGLAGDAAIGLPTLEDTRLACRASLLMYQYESNEGSDVDLCKAEDLSTPQSTALLGSPPNGASATAAATFGKELKEAVREAQEKYDLVLPPDGDEMARNFQLICSKKYDTECAVLISPSRKRVVVAFVGSESLTDWFISIWQGLRSRTPLEIGDAAAEDPSFVHRGWRECYFSVQPDLEHQIAAVCKAYAGPGWRVLMTGHSLGGVMATLCALRLNAAQKPGAVEQGLSKELVDAVDGLPLSLVTIGQPRLGGEQFARYLDAQPFDKLRVVNKGDKITHLPPQVYPYNPSTWSNNYAHGAQQMYIDTRWKDAPVLHTSDDSDDALGSFPLLSGFRGPHSLVDTYLPFFENDIVPSSWPTHYSPPS